MVGPSRLAVPLVIVRDGAVRAEGNLWLSSPEARQLFLGLAKLVNGVVATPEDYAHLFGKRSPDHP